MWIVLSHLSSSVPGVAAISAVLAASVGTVFRYPYMWRYLEARLRIRNLEDGARQHRAAIGPDEASHISAGQPGDPGDRLAMPAMRLGGKEEAKTATSASRVGAPPSAGQRTAPATSHFSHTSHSSHAGLG